MTRPLERLGVDDLEALAAPPGIASKDLSAIADELEHRKSLRTRMLLAKIRLKLKPPATSAQVDTRDLVGTPTPTQNGFEFDLPIFAPVELQKPKLVLTPKVVAQPVTSALPGVTSPVAAVVESEPIAMSVEKAYRVLKATSASTWDAIEFSRRQTVGRAQPDRVAKLESAKRKALQDEAREANAAYKVLLQVRS